MIKLVLSKIIKQKAREYLIKYWLYVSDFKCFYHLILMLNL